MQTAHVAVDARKPQEAGAVIDQFFEHSGGEFLLAHEIYEDPRIEIAAAGSHDHPAGGRQSHASIDRLANFDGRDACAIAEVSDDKAVGQILRELANDRFTRKTVKSVALDSVRPQFLGDRKNPGDRWQIGVKGGVETGDLRDTGKMLSCEADDRERRRHVQRRKCRRGFKLPQHLIIDATMLPKFGAAMHDAVPDGIRRRHVGGGKKL